MSMTFVMNCNELPLLDALCMSILCNVKLLLFIQNTAYCLVQIAFMSRCLRREQQGQGPQY